MSNTTSEEQPKSQTQFMFIDSSNGGINAKPDKVVRSFVMKSARHKKIWSTRPKSEIIEQAINIKRKRRLSSRKDNTRSTASPGSIRSDSIFSSNSGGWTCQSLLSSFTSPSAEYETAVDVYDFLQPRQVQSPRQETFDARVLRSFDCLVVCLDPKAERLLHQFVQAASPRLIPIDPYRSSEGAALSWATACIQSPIGAPFIYAALTSSSRAAQVESEIYKWRAMSEVNGLLSDLRTSTNDVTIAAVLMLLAIEEADLADPRRRGDDRESSVSVDDAHHNGLKTMIRQRGGLAALSRNRCLQVCLLMHSVAQSITTFKQPYALLVEANGQIEDYAISTNRTPREFVDILQVFRDLGVDRSLLKILFAVTAFSADLSAWYDVGTCKIDALELQKHASLLMYRLFDWSQHNEQKEGTELSPTKLVDQSICLASLVFMVHATEPNATTCGARLSRIVNKLRHDLEQTTVYQWNKAPSVLFWVLTIGTLGATSLKKGIKRVRSDSDLAFFQQQMRSAFIGDIPAHPISTEQLLDQLHLCLWIPSVFDERAKSLWASMGLRGFSFLDPEDTSSSEGEQMVEEDYALGKSTALRFFTNETHAFSRTSSCQ
ncbi:hypothetical protein EK21DRAFT_104070 [Setomelanomma holmii]|uniref:Uncharacterized protein n=1 Tax=Setomelanomma holmii TaxID=210430 RepID=A0A9P4H0B6_9PLEO|nr:hypothetical protein EK21DRAFT_104070 [Setomelanomma holmii]